MRTLGGGCVSAVRSHPAARRRRASAWRVSTAIDWSRFRDAGPGWRPGEPRCPAEEADRPLLGHWLLESVPEQDFTVRWSSERRMGDVGHTRAARRSPTSEWTCVHRGADQLESRTPTRAAQEAQWLEAQAPSIDARAWSDHALVHSAVDALGLRRVGDAPARAADAAVTAWRRVGLIDVALSPRALSTVSSPARRATTPDHAAQLPSPTLCGATGSQIAARAPTLVGGANPVDRTPLSVKPKPRRPVRSTMLTSSAEVRLPPATRRRLLHAQAWLANVARNRAPMLAWLLPQ